MLLARNPDGIITMNGRQLAALGRRLTGGGQHAQKSQPVSTATPELEDVQ
ncbi:MAG TPA: hypothetical protein VHN16_01730 [Streptosporangiaceae bacterium]|nr:hypothetical protein [Streptosporangiaceae bacterium]